MAGHSKWANIRFRKGAQDAKRGKLFTKLIREITVAARASGGDPGSNPRLRAAIAKAKAQSMTRDSIERAIRRGTGDDEGAAYEEVRYEGYGPGGVAIMVDCLTDNRNRTVADGSVAYLFTHTGLLSYARGSNEEKLMEAAIEAGATDVVSNADGSIDVLSEPGSFESLREAMQKAGLAPEHAEVTMRAVTSVPVGPGEAEMLLRLLDILDELDDVQQVYSNADIPENLLAESA
jgi:YebC/PmpR family DNA-binding regulatory protein